MDRVNSISNTKVLGFVFQNSQARDARHDILAGHKVSQAMIPAEQMKQVRPDAELWTAPEEMNRDGVNQLPVMVDGQIQGMLSQKDVVGYLRTLRELSV